MRTRRAQQMLEGAACVGAPVLAAYGAAALAERAGAALVSQVAIFLVVAQGAWMLALAGFLARWAPDPKAGGRDPLAGDAWLTGGMFLATLALIGMAYWLGGFATGGGRGALAGAALMGTALVGVLLYANRSD